MREGGKGNTKKKKRRRKAKGGGGKTSTEVTGGAKDLARGVEEGVLGNEEAGVGD